MARSYIGTSGWSYREWTGGFYPRGLEAGRFLEHYARRFATVELNASFYRPLAAEAIRKWVAATGDDFVFAVKGSKQVTHIYRLQQPEATLSTFFDSLASFGAKLGPVLFQLPPRWRKDTPRLAAFLAALPAGQRCVLELRDASWLDEEVYALLRAHDVAFCIYDLAGFETPHVVTASFVYIRLHGPGTGKYIGSYPPAALQRWAQEIRAWLSEGRDVYCYFDNTADGSATGNAQELEALVAGGQPVLRRAGD
jgi:uncharacterized protein YecE (DUF72 family)